MLFLFMEAGESMDMLDQARLCRLQMCQLFESVEAYNDFKGRELCAGQLTPKNAQVNRTAIKRQIVSLRQSLLNLSDMLEGD